METITQVRRTSTEVDSHGLPIWEETEIELQGMVATRQSSSIFSADFITVSDGLTIYLPTNTEVLDGDKFVVRDKQYEIDGEAFDWRNGLNGWSPGTVINLKRARNG